MAMGRPRAFDTDRALDKALQVFWQKGFEAASVSDLTQAMGINPPSLYAAFGNKEALFLKVLERYATGSGGYLQEALEAPTARAMVERMLRGAAELQTGTGHPRGCLLVNAIAACSDDGGEIGRDLKARAAASDLALRRRLERARAEGELAPGTDTAALARFINTMIQGMAVQAAGGASRVELQRVVDTALRAWPAAKPRRRKA